MKCEQKLQFTDLPIRQVITEEKKRLKKIFLPVCSQQIDSSAEQHIDLSDFSINKDLILEILRKKINDRQRTSWVSIVKVTSILFYQQNQFQGGMIEIKASLKKKNILCRL